MAPWGLLLACIPKKWGWFNKFSAFGIPALEENRHKVLRFTVWLNVVGFVMAVLGLMGGFSSGGFFLEKFHWARMHDAKGKVVLAGVKHMCDVIDIDRKTRLEGCKKIVEIQCDKLHEMRTQCDACQHQTSIMIVPMIIACITYLTLERNTMHRYKGKDSRQAKVMASFASFFGVTNFLLVLLGYWKTCIEFAKKYDNVEVSMGLGLLLMGIGAAGFKFITGFIHIGLPVEGDEEDEDELLSESESDDGPRKGGNSSESS